MEREVATSKLLGQAVFRKYSGVCIVSAVKSWHVVWLQYVESVTFMDAIGLCQLLNKYIWNTIEFQKSFDEHNLS